MRQTCFLTQISKTLLEEIDCPLVVGGDFNAVINPALDKSQSDTTANPSSKLLNKFITELNLIDLWRIQNTKARDFTFFSNRHKTSLLSNQTFITSLKEYIKDFLEINMPSDVDPQILGKRLSVAIRGFCISSLLLLPKRELTSLHIRK